MLGPRPSPPPISRATTMYASCVRPGCDKIAHTEKTPDNGRLLSVSSPPGRGRCLAAYTEADCLPTQPRARLRGERVSQATACDRRGGWHSAAPRGGGLAAAVFETRFKDGGLSPRHRCGVSVTPVRRFILLWQ
jgi:hypothetical protein